MNIFRKLQQNSLYWRYRFVTPRYLATRRWLRERRNPRPRLRVMKVAPRGTASFNPYARAGQVNNVRGIAFVTTLAALWTALALSPLAAGVPVGLAQIAALTILIYAFVRFW